MFTFYIDEVQNLPDLPTPACPSTTNRTSFCTLHGEIIALRLLVAIIIANENKVEIQLHRFGV